MKGYSGGFRRRANPLPMVFRLSFLYSFLSLPAWYVLKGFSREGIVDLLGVFFSVLILLMVFLIRLRAHINSRTDRVMSGIQVTPTDSSGGQENPAQIRQSFTFRSYAGLNAEVMFSYLRPYMSMLAGLVFLGLLVFAVATGIEIVRTLLALGLTLYYLALPWLIFVLKTRRVYKTLKPYLDLQVLTFRSGSIGVCAGDSPEKELKQLEDIAITRKYLLLFFNGSNYVQIQRRLLDESGEGNVLELALRLMKDVP